MGFFQGTEERVRNSRGRQAISVRATEVLLYIFKLSQNATTEDDKILQRLSMKTMNKYKNDNQSLGFIEALDRN